MVLAPESLNIAYLDALGKVPCSEQHGRARGRHEAEAAPGVLQSFQLIVLVYPQDPWTSMVYTWALKGFLYPDFVVCV